MVQALCFSITAGVHSSADVTDGVFAPVEKDKRYNLGFEFDGVNRTVYVSGVIMTRIQQKINWIKMHALQEAEKPVSDPFITTGT